MASIQGKFAANFIPMASSMANTEKKAFQESPALQVGIVSVIELKPQRNYTHTDMEMLTKNASGGEFAGSVEYGAKNLVFALNGVTGIPNSNTFAILQPWTSAFDEGCRTFATKIDQTKRKIQELRIDIESAMKKRHA